MITIAYAADGKELSRFDWETEGEKITSSDAFDKTKRAPPIDDKVNKCTSEYYENKCDELEDEYKTPEIIQKMLAIVMQNCYNTDVGEPRQPLPILERYVKNNHYKFAVNAICTMILMRDVSWRLESSLLPHIYTMLIDQWAQLGNYDETMCDFADWLAICHGNNAAYVYTGL